MSIATMNWALGQRLETHQQQILLYVIADSADPSGVTRHCDPDYMAERARLSRATTYRRLGELEDLGVLSRFKFYSEHGAPIYEIRLNLEAQIDMPIRTRRRGEDDDDGSDQDGSQEAREDGEGAATQPPESQAETLVGEAQSHSRETGAVAEVRLAQSQSGDCISPPLSKNLPPNPPPGGAISKQEVEQSKQRTALWERFVASYPGIAAMDQGAAREEFDRLSLPDAEWAANVLVALKEELRKANNRPPKNAHIWLRKGMFRNFAKPRAPPRDAPAVVRYAVDSIEGRALIALHAVGRTPLFEYGTVAYAGEITPQLLAFAQAGPASQWMFIDQRPQIAAWLEFIAAHIRNNRGSMMTSQGVGSERREGIKVPWPWPPRKDGTVYGDTPQVGETNEEFPDDEAAPEAP